MQELSSQALNELSPVLQARVLAELEPDERLVWVGKPRAVWFDPGAGLIMLFGIPFTAFAVFWICGAAQFQFPDFRNPGSFFCLFGIPILLVGLGMLSAPIWLYRAALRTVYFISERRIVTIEAQWYVITRSYLPGQINDIFRREYGDGSGDLVFHRRYRTDSEGHTSKQEFGLMRIERVKEVEKLVRQLSERHAPADPSLQDVETAPQKD